MSWNSKNNSKAYRIGIGLQIVGGLLIAASFIMFLLHFADVMSFGVPSSFEKRTEWDAFGGVAGILLLFVGRLLHHFGRRAGMVSDAIPDEAIRRDVEFYRKIPGGKQVEADDERQRTGIGQSIPVLMMKCGSCGVLNEESANYCKGCGSKM
ncbi:MAG: zinc ribbon domain-containing protein [Planctomyces sp.]|nr:zinc ribbon domain-containing protein [Planctomyces sp.]